MDVETTKEMKNFLEEIQKNFLEIKHMIMKDFTEITIQTKI